VLARSILSELRLEQQCVGDNPATLFEFAHAAAQRDACKDDVYKMNGTPMQHVTAMWAVQKLGWAWILDSKRLSVSPNDPTLREQLECIVRMTGQSAIPKKMQIRTVGRVMNSVLEPTGVTLAYEETGTNRASAYTLYLKGSLPDFLSSKLETRPLLGSSSWNSFFTLAKHTKCSMRCNYDDFYCPKERPIAVEVRRLRGELDDIIQKITCERPPASATPTDLDHALRLRGALDYTPEVLLTFSKDGRWRQRLEQLRALCSERARIEAEAQASRAAATARARARYTADALARANADALARAKADAEARAEAWTEAKTQCPADELSESRTEVLSLIKDAFSEELRLEYHNHIRETLEFFTN